LNDVSIFAIHTKTGNGDKISGRVVYPAFDADNDSVSLSNFFTCEVMNRATAGSCIKEVTIRGLNYEFTENQIL
jgi:hypothetical protein